VSLLMDALKKAEQAKRLAQGTAGGGPRAGSAPSAPTAPDGAAPPGALPRLPTKLELLDDQFSLPGTGNPSWRAEDGLASSGQEEAEREAAAQLFAVKNEPSQKPFLIGLSLFTLTAVAAIGGYFWWQLQPKTFSLLAPAPTQPTPPALAPAAPKSPLPTPTLASPPSPQVPAALPALGLPTAKGTPAQPKASVADNSATTPRAVLPSAAPAPERIVRPAPRRESSDLAPSAEDEAPIRIGRERLRVEPAVARGYRLFQAGDVPAARREYETALRDDPNSLDALHGLAAISVSAGQTEAAEALYRRALEADPRDPTATAALLGLRGDIDPRRAEERLSALAAEQGESHAAQFALGNVYAARGQWREAQQTYFQAHTGDPANADYQFNLAVSLDHLRRPRLALQHYQGALAAAATRPAAFSAAQAAARVRELQQEVQP
jgi:Tfp pilus assembly protein PilF